MSPVQSSTRTVPRAGLHHEVVESGPLLMNSGTLADACGVAVLTGSALAVLWTWPTTPTTS
jgi:hypothetical protein